jgi:RhtB (resistance to homoserine/threonine) family protein
MLDQILVIVAVTSLVMITPGPDMVLVLRNTLVSGRRSGLHTSLGILAGNLVHITYCVLGIDWLISQSIVAYSTLKYAGAAYLIYLGIMSWRSGADTPATSLIFNQRPRRSSFLQGFLNNLLNPKGALFYLGVFTNVISTDTSSTAMVVLICVMMLVSACFWLCFVHTLTRAGVRGLVHRSQQTVSRVFGALLIALGLRVALSER